MIALVIDFGGTNIKMGITREGKILARQSFPAQSDRGIKPGLAQVEGALEGLLDQAGVPRDGLSCLGIAMPGIVDVRAKRVLDINDKYTDALDFDFSAWARDSFDLPLVIENDAKSAILGEISYGCCPGETDAVLMTFGTGIGTAAVMGGKLLRGAHHQAGCLGGHFSINEEGRPCSCGGRGCVEAESGGWALPAIAREQKGFAESPLAGAAEIDYKTVMDLADKGDPVSAKLLETLLRRWAMGAVNLVHAYDPAAVILSGGAMKNSERILPYIKEYLSRHAWTPWGDLRILASEDPDASVLLGLHKLCLEETSQ